MNRNAIQKPKLVQQIYFSSWNQNAKTLAKARNFCLWQCLIHSLIWKLLQSLLPNGTLGAIGANVQPPVVLDPSSGLVPVVILNLPEAPVVLEIKPRLSLVSKLSVQVASFIHICLLPCFFGHLALPCFMMILCCCCCCCRLLWDAGNNVVADFAR